MKPLFSRRHRRAVVGIVVLATGSVLVLPRALAEDVKVRIQGIDNPLRSNVHQALSLDGKHQKPWSGEQIRRLYRLAPKQIKQALQPYGYFNPKIDDTLKAPKGHGKTWRARFHIDHGPPTRISRLHVAAHGPGAQLSAVQKALQQTKLAKGKRLVESQYSNTKNALYNAAYNAGYLDAHFSQSTIRVNPGKNTAAIDLVLQTGERYYFGPVTFDQSLLNDKFLHRFVPFSAGQPYDSQKLIALQLALSQSDYFSQIDIQAPRDQARRTYPTLDQWFYDLLYPPPDPLEPLGQLRVPVTVKATPSKGQSYRISAGYGTDTGPRVGLGVKFRHLNRYGHQFSANLRLSQVQRTLSASYDIPIQNVSKDKLSFTATVSNAQYGDITSNLYGVGVIRSTGWALGRKRAYLKYQREYYDIGHGAQHSTLLYPGYNFTLQKADSMVFTRHGESVSADIHGGTTYLGSSTSFVEGDVSGHWVISPTARTRLVMRSEIGAIAASDFSRVPPSQRFFAGGAQSVRGYSYQSISPTNSNNKDIGGRYLATGSIEGDYFFYKKFGVAAFFDAGDVTDHIGHFSPKRGVGIGFRWASPVGMVRLDVAHPLDGSHAPVTVDFSLGPDL